MRKAIIAASLAAAAAIPAAPALAQYDYNRNGVYDRYDRAMDNNRYYNGDRYYERTSNRYYRERRLTRSDRVWRGRDGRYHCRRSDGTTGLIVGAALGGVLGNSIAGRGDRTLGTILGLAGGGLLGREIDRGGVRCR
jgi:uncharacterized protein YcfJ